MTERALLQQDPFDKLACIALEFECRGCGHHPAAHWDQHPMALYKADDTDQAVARFFDCIAGYKIFWNAPSIDFQCTHCADSLPLPHIGQVANTTPARIASQCSFCIELQEFHSALQKYPQNYGCGLANSCSALEQLPIFYKQMRLQ